ncbi:MAG: lasso peptide biosynthesis PqqD family chaperone [Actinomycetota bacterium]|jgi:PqqD family protein of HPr-rel-A system|nr:lasso peptide biosynthesis PqqD family chaperone [Actinomycetota bacterium]
MSFLGIGAYEDRYKRSPASVTMVVEDHLGTVIEEWNKVRLRADVSTVDTDDGLVLLDERSGKYYQLNSSGAVVLRALLEGGSTEAAVRALCERFPHQTDRIGTDVAAVVAHLRTVGLITPD